MGENSQAKIVISRKLPTETPRIAPPRSTPPSESAPLIRLEQLKVKHWHRFLVELRTALTAGLPLLSALALTIKSSDKAYLREIARKLHTAISKGARLESALNFADEIPSIIRNTFIAGARSGSLPQVLDFLIEHFSWMMDIRSRILRLILYPAALVILGVMIMIFRDIMIRHLGPKKESVSDIWLQITAQYFFPLLVGSLAAIVLSLLIKGRKTKPAFDKWIIKIPILGECIKNYNITLFFQMLSTALKSGLPVEPSFRMALHSCPNAYIREALLPAATHLRHGCSFTESFLKTGLLNKSILGSLRSGEVSGNLPLILDKVTTWHKKHLQTQIAGLLAGISPFIILLIAGAFFGGPIYFALAAFLIVFGRRII